MSWSRKSRLSDRGTSFYLPLILFFILSYSARAQKIKVSESLTIDQLANSLIPRVQIVNDPSYFNLEDRMNMYDVPGFAMATIQNGAIQSARGYGFARKAEGVKVSEKTVFQAGSISKSITAILVLKLQDEGVLDIDTNVSEYLKSWHLPKSKYLKKNKITLRHLLSHTSGLKAAQRMKLDQIGYHHDENAPSLNDILDGKTFLQKVDFDSKPGEVHKYSNQGYNLIQKILEDITGEAFEDLAQRIILEPFDMKESTFETIKQTSENIQYSYSYRHGEVKPGYWRNLATKCSGGLYATPSDLSRFIIKVARIINGEDLFLSHETSKELMDGEEYNLGFQLIENKGSKLIAHSGRTSGFFAYMIIDPNTYNGYVMMTNSDDANSLFGEVLRGATHTYDWDFAKPKFIETIEIDKEFEATLLGDYFYKGKEEDETVRIERRNGKLVYYVVEEDPGYFPLGAVSQDLLFDLIDGNELKLIREKGEIKKIIYDGEYEYVKMN